MGDAEVEDDGVPPVKLHCRDVGLPVELSVKVTVSPTQTLVGLPVKEAEGGEPPTNLLVNTPRPKVDAITVESEVLD